MQLAEHLQDAGDLPAHRGLPPAAVPGQVRAEVAVGCVLEHERVEE